MSNTKVYRPQGGDELIFASGGTLTMQEGSVVADVTGRLCNSVDVTLTAAQMLALNATPVTLVAAPGAGYALVFEGAALFLDYNSAAYAGIDSGDDLAVKYTNSSGTAVGGCEATGFLDATADAIRYVRATGAASSVSQITPVANSPLKVRTFYRTIPTSL